MASNKSYMILRNAFKIYTAREKYAYFYDAKGIVLTDAAMDYLINLHWDDHFNRYSSADLKKIKNYSRNKIGYDCTGFIWAISGIGGSANWIFENATVNKKSVEEGKAGALLWKPGHAGIDIGYGYCMDFPIEMHTAEIVKIQTRGFMKSGELQGYDYSDANHY